MRARGRLDELPSPFLQHSRQRSEPHAYCFDRRTGHPTYTTVRLWSTTPTATRITARTDTHFYRCDRQQRSDQTGQREWKSISSCLFPYPLRLQLRLARGQSPGGQQPPVVYLVHELTSLAFGKQRATPSPRAHFDDGIAAPRQSALPHRILVPNLRQCGYSRRSIVSVC